MYTTFCSIISKKVRKSDALAKLNIAKAISTLQIITILCDERVQQCYMMKSKEHLSYSSFIHL